MPAPMGAGEVSVPDLGSGNMTSVAPKGQEANEQKCPNGAAVTRTREHSLREEPNPNPSGP